MVNQHEGLLGIPTVQQPTASGGNGGTRGTDCELASQQKHDLRRRDTQTR